MGREEAGRAARESRDELSRGLAAANVTLAATLKSMSEVQRAQLDGMSRSLKGFSESNQAALDRIRTTVDSRVRELQDGDEKKLEEMRKTVDDKLQTTLEKHLGESFKLVSDQLESVQKGLGEMQSLATGVGDLKRVLSNVKARGMWAEVQLGALLDEILARAYGYPSTPSSRNRTTSASRMPPTSATSRSRGRPRRHWPAPTVWRPRTSTARTSSRRTSPTSPSCSWPPRGCKRRSSARRRWSTICSSLRMGFRTLAIEQQAVEVWRVLGGVKTEFARFGDVLAKVKRQLETASRTIDQTGVRTRAMERKLRAVEQLPDDEAERGLDLAAPDDELEPSEFEPGAGPAEDDETTFQRPRGRPAPRSDDGVEGRPLGDSRQGFGGNVSR